MVTKSHWQIHFEHEHERTIIAAMDSEIGSLTNQLRPLVDYVAFSAQEFHNYHLPVNDLARLHETVYA